MNVSESDNVQPIFVVSGWGERFPLRFKCELEFGLDGYSGILTKELAAIEKMIEVQGIGKKGEKYVRSVFRRQWSNPWTNAPLQDRRLCKGLSGHSGTIPPSMKAIRALRF